MTHQASLSALRATRARRWFRARPSATPGLAHVFAELTGYHVTDPATAPAQVLEAARAHQERTRRRDDIELVVELFEHGHVAAAELVATRCGVWYHAPAAPTVPTC